MVFGEAATTAPDDDDDDGKSAWGGSHWPGSAFPGGGQPDDDDAGTVFDDAASVGTFLSWIELRV